MHVATGPCTDAPVAIGGVDFGLCSSKFWDSVTVGCHFVCVCLGGGEKGEVGKEGGGEKEMVFEYGRPLSVSSVHDCWVSA